MPFLFPVKTVGSVASIIQHVDRPPGTEIFIKNVTFTSNQDMIFAEHYSFLYDATPSHHRIAMYNKRPINSKNVPVPLFEGSREWPIGYILYLRAFPQIACTGSWTVEYQVVSEEKKRWF